MLPFSIEGLLSDDLVRSSIAAQTRNLQLSLEHTSDSMGDFIRFHFEDPLTPRESEWHQLVVKDMPHVYPNGTNWPFEIAPFFWEFFSQHQMPVVAATDELDIRSFPCIFPKPLRKQSIAFDCLDNEPGQWTLKVYDVYGRQWLDQSIDGSITLDGLPKGVLIWVISRNGRRVYTEKVIRL